MSVKIRIQIRGIRLRRVYRDGLLHLYRGDRLVARECYRWEEILCLAFLSLSCIVHLMAYKLSRQCR